MPGKFGTSNLRPFPKRLEVQRGYRAVFLAFCWVAVSWAAAGTNPEENLVISEEWAPHYVDPTTVSRQISFAKGESLAFKLGWSLFTVAEATLTTSPREASPEVPFPTLDIELNARTNSFADGFYKVRNYSKSIVKRDLSGSLRYVSLQNENSKERHRVYAIDQEKRTATYHNLKSGEDPTDPIPVRAGTFDPLGIVFFVRTLDFEVGDVLVIPTTNGKEFFFTVVYVTKKVERNFASGKQEAFVLEPDIKDIGGVFKRSPNGSIRFFFSTDDEKRPLRMESEVAVGKFWAELLP